MQGCDMAAYKQGRDNMTQAQAMTKEQQIAKAQRILQVKQRALSKLEWDMAAGLHFVTNNPDIDGRELQQATMDDLQARIDLLTSDIALATGERSFTPEWLRQRNTAAARVDKAQARLHGLLARVHAS